MSPGLVVRVEDMHSRLSVFKSQHRISNGYFYHYIVVKIVMFVRKRPKINEKEAGFGPYFKNDNNSDAYLGTNSIRTVLAYLPM